MRKIQLFFIAIAAIGICSAYAEQNKSLSCNQYVGIEVINGKVYFQDDPNQAGIQAWEIPCSWTMGNEYDCIAPFDPVCTVQVAQDVIIYYDSARNLYYVYEVDVITIEFGTFVLNE